MMSSVILLSMLMILLYTIGDKVNNLWQQFELTSNLNLTYGHNRFGQEWIVDFTAVNLSLVRLNKLWCSGIKR